MTYFFKSIKGKRDTNEDGHSIVINIDGRDSTKANINLYAIYDGHGGKTVSQFLEINFPRLFTYNKLIYPIDSEKIREIYEKLDNSLRTKYFKYANESGSTCLAIIQYNHKNSQYLRILNTGDCRAVLCNKMLALPLTLDHKPIWPNEARRLELLGIKAKYESNDYRIGGLSVSRAFGDYSTKGVIFYPNSYIHKLDQKYDKFIIMACDGLWDKVDNQEAVNFVLNECYDINYKRLNENNNIAEKLCKLALEVGSTDNISVIVIFFD